MSSNVYVLIFLLLYSIELNIGVRPIQACIRIIMFICGEFAVGTRPSEADPEFVTVVPVVASRSC